MHHDVTAYQEEISAWRAAAEKTLRAPDSWLSVAGLFWLSEGVNRIGSHQQSEVQLPADMPPFVGEICLRDGAVSLGVAGPELLLNGEPPSDRPLRSDAEPPADQLVIGRVSLQLLRRGARFGLRLRDPESATRRAFAGRRWYEPDLAYRLLARFEPYAEPRSIAITDILGDTKDQLSPGEAAFEIAGQELRLAAVPGANGALFFNFRDQTAGQTTYGAGRFLYAAPPVDGLVLLDFNQAVSPPCAFTAFATCPLPPPQNRLPVPIPAGEQYGEA